MLVSIHLLRLLALLLSSGAALAAPSSSSPSSSESLLRARGKNDVKVPIAPACADLLAGGEAPACPLGAATCAANPCSPMTEAPGLSMHDAKSVRAFSQLVAQALPAARGLEPSTREAVAAAEAGLPARPEQAHVQALAGAAADLAEYNGGNGNFLELRERAAAELSTGEERSRWVSAVSRALRRGLDHRVSHALIGSAVVLLFASLISLVALLSVPNFNPPAEAVRATAVMTIVSFFGVVVLGMALKDKPRKEGQWINRITFDPNNRV